ncbi:MAG TPA: efflux transporter outer membrane subunit [Candidatus Acidoferrum sp.]|nr:efflux transporter outer membrane subunit [Candidatus Acidoferrum sp.]
MTRQRILTLCAVGIIVAGCTVGPDYRRPDVTMPSAYRGAGAAAPTPVPAPTFGDLGWWQLFQDPNLQELIRTALAANYDLQMAVSRILQAQAQVTIVRSQQFPTVNAQADAQYTAYVGGNRPVVPPAQTFTPEGGLTIGWELDLWGKFRRATEAARAQLLASEDVRNAVVTSLVAQVADAYFTLRTLDLDLEISKRTVVSREQSRDLVRARLEGGVSGILDLQQAETLLYTATKSIPDIERQTVQTENFISILLGKDPGPIPRGRPLDQQLVPPTLPPGLPSELLVRRPDIRQAEQQLIAANAQIGVAKAKLFPQVTLSGFVGGGGIMINGQTFGPLGIFSALPVITLPLFNAGALAAGVDLADLQTQEAVFNYQQTILQALREVADGLVEVQKRREFRIEQEKLTRTLADASQTSRIRYEGGVSSYLEVLDTERQYFQAELDLTLAQRDEVTAIVLLYRALGGGWQTEG